MRRGLLAAVGVVAVIVVIALVLTFVSSYTGGEDARARGSQKSAAKTAWGDPDLQGIWTDVYQTPLQRPAKYASREFLTNEERAELDRLRAAAPRQNDVGIAPRGTEQDVSGAYNSVFTMMRRTGRRTSLIVDPPDGRIPALTSEAQKRRAEYRAFQLALLQATDVCKNHLAGCAGGQYGPPSPRRNDVPPTYVAAGGIGGGAINRADGPEDRSLGERCLGGALPDFSGYRQIVQTIGAVSIFYDTGQGQGWERVVPVSSNPTHLPRKVRLWWGDSRGHWEGNTLVVDVTNFTPKSDFQGARDNLHLVERWTRLDSNTLEYLVTIEDPTTWTRPWTVTQELVKQPNEQNRIYMEPRCHEGNYGLVGLLSGSRAAERDFAARRGPDPATLCGAGCGTGIEEVADTDGVRDGAIGGIR
jgi:hypothetical protein